MKEFHSSELLASTAPAVEFIVDGLLPAGSAGADISGPPGEGKSTIALSLCAAVSTGRPWFGLRTACAPAAWITGEASSRNALARDLQRLNIPHDSDILFIAPERELFRFESDHWGTTDEGERVLARLGEMNVGFVILDTIGSLVAGSREIDNDQQRQLARHLRACLQGLTWLTVSHTNQSSAKDDLPWRLHYLSRAGGNGFPGALRWAAGVSALHDAEIESLGLLAGRRYVALGGSKHNEMGRPVWTNRAPAIFEITETGALVLVRDGRETPKKEKAQKQKGGHHEQCPNDWK
jgi:hypothetical protein